MPLGKAGVMSADEQLLAFVLQHGASVAGMLRAHGRTVRREADELNGHARERMLAHARDVENRVADLEWFVKVNKPDWSHDEHTADCQSDWTVEACKSITMTPDTLRHNHAQHMKVVRRIEAALRSVR